MRVAFLVDETDLVVLDEGNGRSFCGMLQGDRNIGHSSLK